MGDPRFVVGLPYEVGTCKAQGVCLSPYVALKSYAHRLCSLLPVLPVSHALRQLRSNLIATRLIRTAATVLMLLRTTATELSTDKLLLPSSKANLQLRDEALKIIFLVGSVVLYAHSVYI